MPATAQNLLTRFRNPILVHRSLKQRTKSRPARMIVSASTRRPAPVVVTRHQLNTKQLVDASRTQMDQNPSKIRGKNAPGLVWQRRIFALIVWGRYAV